jgi:hypothetical protein
MRHKHIGTFLGSAIHELVEANKTFQAKIAQAKRRHTANNSDTGRLLATGIVELERLHAPVIEARERLLHLLAQEAISEEEVAALLAPHV